MLRCRGRCRFGWRGGREFRGRFWRGFGGILLRRRGVGWRFCGLRRGGGRFCGCRRWGATGMLRACCCGGPGGGGTRGCFIGLVNRGGGGGGFWGFEREFCGGLCTHV